MIIDVREDFFLILLLHWAVTVQSQLKNSVPAVFLLKDTEVEIDDDARSGILAKFTSLVILHSFN